MKKIGIFLADGFEEIEGLTVVDILRRAGVEAQMISVMGKKEICGSHNIHVQADELYEDVDFAGRRAAGRYAGDAEPWRARRRE